MFIKNLKTNMIQECSNVDVIKICKKSPLEYAVAKTKEELLSKDKSETEGAEEGQSESSVDSVDYDEMKIEDLKKLAKDKGIEGYSKMRKEELVAALEATEMPEGVE